MDSNRDLSLHRQIDLPPERIWRAWTEPELMKQWFTPAPWRTEEVEMDLVPGGIFRTVMSGPDGERNEGTGCILEAVEPRRLAWTSASGPGFRPQPEGELQFSAVIEMEPNGQGGTDYRVTLRHPDAATKEQHEAMGFEEGWGKALDQLIDLMRSR